MRTPNIWVLINEWMSWMEAGQGSRVVDSFGVLACQGCTSRTINYLANRCLVNNHRFIQFWMFPLWCLRFLATLWPARVCLSRWDCSKHQTAKVNLPTLRQALISRRQHNWQLLYHSFLVNVPSIDLVRCDWKDHIKRKKKKWTHGELNPGPFPSVV